MRKVCIIGGGPAGLGATYALRRAGIDYRLFEAGPALLARRHDRADELGYGIGGAGLFSDGKFSYFPSGTGLYQLGNAPRLRQSYRAITELLTEIGIPAPSFPSEPAALSGSTTGFSHKSYGSQYGSLPQRRELVRRLCGEHDDRIRSLCEVVAAASTTQGYKVRYRELPTGELRTELFSDLVLATGRFGGTALEQLLGPPRIALQEQRYEIGIRIEHPNGRGFLGQLKDNDVKLILDGDGLQIRTFCTCRDGEVWHIPYPGGSALSGRSDGPRSGFSNFGLLPRFSGERCDQGRAIWRHFKAHLGDSRMAFWQPLPEFLGGAPVGAANDAPPQRPWQPRDHFVRGPIDQLIHSELRAALRGGLHALLAQYPDLDSPETICLFPAIEGVGLFPATDADLKVETESIWCCGDVAGRFRGLVPALVSGDYVGQAIAAKYAGKIPDGALVDFAAARRGAGSDQLQL